MPTYDYRCDACGETYEKFQSIMADPIPVCEVCGEEKARRLIGTGAAILFKGGGFYETDYRSDAYARDAKKDAPAESKPEKSDKSDKKESKPETRSEPAAPKAEPVAAKSEPKPTALSSDGGKA